MATPLDSENVIPPRLTLAARPSLPVPADPPVQPVPPRLTLPANLPAEQYDFPVYRPALMETETEPIALPAARGWDAAVLWIELAGIALCTLAIWVALVFFHVLFTYLVFLGVVTTMIASLCASLVYRRAYMQRVQQDARLRTQSMPALHRDTWSHLRAVTADTLSYLAAVGRDRQ